MAFLLADLLHTVKDSRGFFLRHLHELAPETCDWRPYPECKTFRETLFHLIGTDQWILADPKRETGDDFTSLLKASEARLRNRSRAELQVARRASRRRQRTT